MIRKTREVAYFYLPLQCVAAIVLGLEALFLLRDPCNSILHA